MALVTIDRHDDGFWRVTFGGATKGNILDAATMLELTAAFREAAAAPHLKAVVLTGAGAHFSFGASVEEHLPAGVERMLATFRGLLAAMLDSAVVVVAAVRGQCLGGGLELASMCHRVVAAPDATLGQPEIALGVFAPIASVILPGRIGRGAAEDLCLTGRRVDAREALAMGLVDEIVEGDPAEAALAWARAHFAARSASSLRLAVRAIRARFTTAFHEDLDAAERLYLNDLMRTADAVEGLEAFLARRPPAWKDA
jgi:cyclohexa-1,5-dienecarbonyl-CoA hydratase